MLISHPGPIFDVLRVPQHQRTRLLFAGSLRTAVSPCNATIKPREGIKPAGLRKNHHAARVPWLPPAVSPCRSATKWAARNRQVQPPNAPDSLRLSSLIAPSSLQSYDSVLTLFSALGPMVGTHPGQNQLTAAQMQAQQAAQSQASERAKLRSRKPTDKNIPEGVEECIIGDGVQRYRDLRELERRLDATMTRKRLDLQDSVNRNVKV